MGMAFPGNDLIYCITEFEGGVLCGWKMAPSTWVGNPSDEGLWPGGILQFRVSSENNWSAIDAGSDDDVFVPLMSRYLFLRVIVRGFSERGYLSTNERRKRLVANEP